MKYEAKRFELFANSYVGYKLSQYLRNKYGLDRTGGSLIDYWLANFNGVSAYSRVIETLRRQIVKDPGNASLQTSLMAQYSALQKEFTKEIPVLAEYFKFDEVSLRGFILADMKLALEDRPRIVFQKTPFKKIHEKGLYIKVEPNTSLTELKNAYAWIRANRKKVDIENNVFKDLPKRKPERHEKLKLWLYSLVENHMVALDKARRGKGVDDRDDYGDSLVRQAIERAVGKVLEVSDVEEDEVFSRIEKEGKDKLTELYYRVAEEYRLPTPKKLKSILELINQ